MVPKLEVFKLLSDVGKKWTGEDGKGVKVNCFLFPVAFHGKVNSRYGIPVF